MAWETETPETEPIVMPVQTGPTKPPLSPYGSVVKTYLALVDSDIANWGIVEDTLNDLLWEPGKGELVGSWSKAPYDNRIHLSLCTSIAALQDRSIQIFAKYAEERRLKAAGVKTPAASKRVRKTGVMGEPAQVELPTLSVDEVLKFNSLRAKLGRAK